MSLIIYGSLLTPRLRYLKRADLKIEAGKGLRRCVS
jgi:hypothetical protein